MNTIENILTRTSIRKYTDKPISDDDIRTILKAGMSGPTATNAREWSFVVVTDRETIDKMAEVNGRPAQLLKGAPLAILLCGDLDRAVKMAPDFWIIDVAIAGQNMILAAKDLGIGSVWLGTWPLMEKVKGQAELLGLPETVIPHSIIAFGYPAEDPAVKGPEYEEDRVHFERW